MYVVEREHNQSFGAIWPPKSLAKREIHLVFCEEKGNSQSIPFPKLEGYRLLHSRDTQLSIRSVRSYPRSCPALPYRNALQKTDTRISMHAHKSAWLKTNMAAKRWHLLIILGICGVVLWGYCGRKNLKDLPGEEST